jgi:2-dehydro-3-deoxyphosphooctonate aldolase (KDO 8-P synthase)
MRLGNVEVGAREPLFLIAGPCVIESAALCEEVAGRMVEITRALGIPYIFKASYDKANRSSRSSFRGPGIDAGLKVLEGVRAKFGVPVLTDVHEDTPLAEVAAVVDVLQTPAFLCRQTNFIVAAASQGKPVNIKKGQFLSPWEMQNVVDKARSTGNPGIMVCERGFSFGYNNLVSDMRSLAVMRGHGVPRGVRCHSLGAIAGWAGKCVRWSARIRAGTCTCCRRGGRCGSFHGNPSRSIQSLVRRPECLAVTAHGFTARDAARA